MIKRNIIQISILFGLNLLLVFWYADWSSKSQYRENNKTSIQQFNILVSQIERIVEQYSLSEEPIGDKSFDNINLLSAVVGWQVVDKNRIVVANYQPDSLLERRNIITRNFYFAVNNSSEPLTLTVDIDLEQLSVASNPPAIKDLGLLVVLLAIMASFVYFSLRWVIQLEEFSKLALVSDSQTPHPDLEVQNIIGFSISQLILNNRILLKSKSELTKQIRLTTYIDDTTELGNHLFFKAELQVRLHNPDELESGQVAILAFVVNDDAHSLEQNKQIAIANCLKQQVEDIDSAIVAKLKDNEFALILPNYTASKTDQFCKKLVKNLSNQVYAKPEQVHHFVDIGISTYQHGFDYYHIMAEADLALRNAQLQGANNWYVYGEPLSQARAKGRLKWQSFLRKILDKRQISLYCQQLHYFDESDNCHSEVLARIKDGKELLNAETFIAMAFQCGLSVEFDRQIVNAVINHILLQQKQSKPIDISVNIFVPSLLDTQFTEWVLAKVSNYPQLASLIIFELSENLLRKHIFEVAPVMSKLSELGVRWCVEHFGSIGEDQGYLDFTNIDFVKIDRRIVHNISESMSQQLLFNAIVVSLKTRRIKLIAEGVERQSDADYLAQTDINAAQGYYFNRPHELNFDPAIKLASN